MPSEETEREEGHLYAKEIKVEQILPPEPSEGVNPANNLLLDFQHPKLWENALLLFMFPSL